MRLSSISKSIAKKMNATDLLPDGSGPSYFDAEALLEPGTPYATPGQRSIITSLVSFDPSGRVNSPNVPPGRWGGRRNVLGVLVLIDEDHPAEKPYAIADWDQGVPGSVFSPAICGQSDMNRYENHWGMVAIYGAFGCREWTAQLYDPDRPYIDVTSYAAHGRTFIGEFVGWSRFRDPAKPVIGRHGRTWLCLHDCPAGEKTGVIPDIKVWAKQHGFPLPIKPPKQPQFPNADFKNVMDD